MSTRAVTCVVADDHPVVLEMVPTLLSESGIDVVGVASDGKEAISIIEANRPDVAVLDVRMPYLNGIEVARHVAHTVPETRVILYTGYGDRTLLAEAHDVGIRGFVRKEAPLADVADAIRIVAEGGTYVDSVLAGVLLSMEATERIPNLTKREREILRLLADGYANEAIGRELFISAETVRTHIRRAMQKLEANTRTQAVAAALRQSLID